MPYIKLWSSKMYLLIFYLINKAIKAKLKLMITYISLNDTQEGKNMEEDGLFLSNTHWNITYW